MAAAAAAAAEKEAKLERFLQWLQANGGQLRGCSIKYCGPSKGFGVFSSHAAGGAPDGNGVLMVVPLDLAITPMRVLQDSSLGSRCAEMFKEGHVDDRFLMTLFLLVERLRRNSPWKPYIDMLPSTFSNPLWFSEDELSELKGTTLYRATLLQKKKLQALFNEKVRSLVEEILHLDGEVEGVHQEENIIKEGNRVFVSTGVVDWQQAISHLAAKIITGHQKERSRYTQRGVFQVYRQRKFLQIMQSKQYDCSAHCVSGISQESENLASLDGDLDSSSWQAAGVLSMEVHPPLTMDSGNREDFLPLVVFDGKTNAPVLDKEGKLDSANQLDVGEFSSNKFLSTWSDEELIQKAEMLGLRITSR